MRIDFTRMLVILSIISTCNNVRGQNEIFNHDKAYIGFSPGLSILIGSDLGYRLNMNAGYLLSNHIGISGLLMTSIHTIGNSDGTGPGRINPISMKENWTYIGVLLGPSFTLSSGGKTHWRISPMAGYCEIIRPDYYQEPPTKISFDLTTDIIFNFNSDKKMAILLSSDLFLTEYVFSTFQSITLNAGIGFIYRFRSHK